jgi:hypothetical protein
MFQAGLGYMMREEQRKDFVRQAEHEDFVRQAELAQREWTDKQPRRVYGVAHALLIAPLVLVTLVSRLIASYLHTIGHSL